MTKPPWLTAEVEALMGTVPDRTLAVQLGVSKSPITDWRNRLQIAPCNPRHRINWDTVDLMTIPAERLAKILPSWLTPKVRETLGTVSDSVVSRDTGVSPATVFTWRNRLRIAPLNPKKNIPWDAIALGQKRDSELAAILGVDISAVHYQRTTRGIPRYDPGIVWGEVGLGVRSDQDIAADLGVARSFVARKRRACGIAAPKREKTTSLPSAAKKIDWNQQPLGQTSDNDLAKRLGVRATRVGAARRRRKIPAHKTLRAPLDASHGLGFLPDTEIARRTGQTPFLVRQARLRLGIPAPKQHIDWSEVEFDGFSNTELAERWGVTQSTIIRMRKRFGTATPATGPDWDYVDKLGKVSDRQLAQAHGVSASTVKRARERRGIAPMGRRIAVEQS